MSTNSVNGDTVQKPFILNGRRYTTGDQFCCASAQGVSRLVHHNQQSQKRREHRQSRKKNNTRNLILTKQATKFSRLGFPARLGRTND